MLEECQKHLHFLLLAGFLSKLLVLVCVASLELEVGTEERSGASSVADVQEGVHWSFCQC